MTTSPFLSRKFLIAALSAVCATVLLVLQVLTPNAYTALMGTIVTVYTTGNVAQKALVASPSA